MLSKGRSCLIDYLPEDEVHRAILILALLIQPLWACCPFDADTLASEAASMPGMLDLVSGRIERLPARYYEQQLETALKDMKASPADFEAVCRAAEAYDMLSRQRDGLAMLDEFPSDKLDVSQRAVRDGLKARLYIHLWLIEIDPVPGTAQEALRASRTARPNRLLDMILEWASNPPLFGPKDMLPDFFGLRMATNKTALTDNNQLRDMDLAGVPDFLAYLLKLHPAWENLDTYHALSLTLAVMGKQHLAHLARLRAFEFLDQQQTTRLPVAHDTGDLRALMIPRQYTAGALVEIPTLSDTTKQQIAAELASRREDARRWLAARESFALKKLGEGKSPGGDASFWQDFVYRPAVAAAAAPATTAPTGDAQSAGMDTTVIVAAACSAVVVVVAMTSLRRRRKPDAPEQSPRA